MMYCPNCAADNADGTRYCRNCGANLSLIPHALQGALPSAPVESRRRRRHGQEGLMAGGIRNAFMGAGFLLLALALIITNQHWGIWMLIPGFTMLGKGAADIFSARNLQGAPPPLSAPIAQHPRTTGELERDRRPPIPPVSVTENTTRYLEDKAERVKERP